MRAVTRQKLLLAGKSFLWGLGFLLIVSVGGNCVASLYRRSHLPSLSELVVPTLIAVFGAIGLTLLEQWPLWRDRVPQRRL